jgi:hypothetical protein
VTAIRIEYRAAFYRMAAKAAHPDGRKGEDGLWRRLDTAAQTLGIK